MGREVSQPMGERRLLLATANQHKIEEFRAILANVPCKLVSPQDLGIDVRIQETGSTFVENAVLKAIAYAEASGLPVLADDSGLEIDALNGEPGIYSSRWAGEDVSYPERFRILFERLTGLPEASRTARYRCAIAIARPAPCGLYNVAEGILEGRIALTPAGDQGFGYDPIFLVPDLNRTVAQITADEKHRISHRGRAAAAAAAMMSHWFDNGDGST
jgi:XTP/dITP diphosphohydrolase